MIDLIKKFFTKNNKNVATENGQKKFHDIRVATCALFLEMANIDGEFSEVEREHIILALKKDYNLSEEYIHALIEASEEELRKGIDLWRFTNLVNQNYSTDEKIRIIEMIWKIAYADRELDKHEDYLVHKLSRLLQLDHKKMIEAKLNIIHGNK
ncbi:MAG: TerB family tellurite resistance protein [Thermodesulfobacteriota bacterium]|nr:TerB family tellurite resistance protein [Thermodesulfobacteriota bacterium]